MNSGFAIKVFLMLATILSLLGLRWMLDQAKPLSTMSAAPVATAEIPDFLLLEGNTRIYDDKGKLSSAMQADKFSFFQKKNITLIENPKFDFMAKDSEWQITATEGILQNDSSYLTLKGGVEFSQKNSDALTLETENLEIDSIKNIVTTNTDILIENSFGVSKGKGLLFDLNTRKLKLIGPISSAFKNSQ
ncbi:MAG: LPS export ABC transporter periplasmic protein LptC [Pseudomonadota bacterium]